MEGNVMQQQMAQGQGEQVATPEEEEKLNKVLLPAVKYLQQKGKDVLLQQVKAGTEVPIAMGEFTYSLLNNINAKAEETGDTIPMGVFVGENGAAHTLMDMEAQWLSANGYKEAESPEVLQAAFTYMTQLHAQQEEGKKGKGTPEQIQELKDAMQDPEFAQAAQQLAGGAQDVQ